MALKVCVINCHLQPDYIRAKVLRDSIKLVEGTEVLVVKNSHLGLLKFPEVVLKTLWLRLTKQPDIYILTFRGYEVLPFIRLIAIGKKLIYDEFINPIEWIAYEHKKINPNGIIVKLIKVYYRQLLKLVNRILADTEEHARFSSKIMNYPINKYMIVPVGTDESVFHLVNNSAKKTSFRVIYYGNMLPLHGLDYVLKAAMKLKDKKDINFLLVGGNKKIKQEIEYAKVAGASIEYRDWISYQDLPKVIRQSSLGLGGPYGDTVQSRLVVTGKTYQMLAMGIPVLIGEAKGKTIFKDGVNCIIARQGSADDLAAKILWAYNHKEKLSKIGQAGRQLYVDNFSNQIISRQLAELLN